MVFLAVPGVRAAEPRATLSLTAPAAVEPGETFNVNIWIEVDSSSYGLGKGGVDLSFDADLVELAGVFNPSQLLQLPFDKKIKGGLAAGKIADLYGETDKVFCGVGEPALFAVIPFRAKQAGAAGFAVSAGESGLALLGGGTLDPETEVACPELAPVTIQKLNHAPVAEPQTVSVSMNESCEISLTASDVDGDELTCLLPAVGESGYPAHGSLVLKTVRRDMSATVVYTPDDGYFGLDTFEFRATDGELESAPATVSLEVGGFTNVITLTTPQDTLNVNLTFAASPSASDAFSKTEGDVLAPPAGMDGTAAYFLLDGGTRLRQDVRLMQSSMVWKLQIPIPIAAANGNWQLSWPAELDLPAGWSAMLTRVSADGQEMLATPMDMGSTTDVSLNPASLNAQNLYFFLSVAPVETVVLDVEAGWNLLGMPLLAGANEQAKFTLNTGFVWSWNAETQMYEMADMLSPGQGFWLYSKAKATLSLSGQAICLSDASPLTCWQLVSTLDEGQAPLEFEAGPLARCWQWDGLTQTYQQATSLWQRHLGYWIFLSK
jgi:hypothetical protein